MIAFTVAGLVVGLAIGMTGVGGGSLMTPLLILIFGFAPSSAVGTDLLYAAGTKGFGTWLHDRQQTVDWPVVGLMAAGSLPAATLTIAWLAWVGLSPWIEQLMTGTLCVAMVATAALTLLRSRLVSKVQQTTIADDDPDSALVRWRPVITLISGAVLGVLVSLSSVGAGVLGTTMLLVLYPRRAAIRIVGTDIAHAVPLTLLAGLGHLTLGTVDLSVLGMLLLGSLPGIFLGTRLGHRLPDRSLRPIISVLLLIVATSMLWKSFGAAVA